MMKIMKMMEMAKMIKMMKMMTMMKMMKMKRMMRIMKMMKMKTKTKTKMKMKMKMKVKMKMKMMKMILRRTPQMIFLCFLHFFLGVNFSTIAVEFCTCHHLSTWSAKKTSGRTKTANMAKVRAIMSKLFFSRDCLVASMARSVNCLGHVSNIQLYRFI